MLRCSGIVCKEIVAAKATSAQNNAVTARVWAISRGAIHGTCQLINKLIWIGLASEALATIKSPD
jgi:hypothetical protein